MTFLRKKMEKLVEELRFEASIGDHDIDRDRAADRIQEILDAATMEGE